MGLDEKFQPMKNIDLNTIYLLTVIIVKYKTINAMFIHGTSKWSIYAAATTNDPLWILTVYRLLVVLNVCNSNDSNWLLVLYFLCWLMSDTDKYFIEFFLIFVVWSLCIYVIVNKTGEFYMRLMSSVWLYFVLYTVGFIASAAGE